MHTKEFSFDEDIRICIYHVGNESLAYHRHTHLSDITYCASGQLMLELPEINASYRFHPGQFVQVPMNMIHRVSHRCPHTNQSSYVLVQVGQFSIDFMHEVPAVDETHCRYVDATRQVCHVGGAQERLALIAQQFIATRPPNLTDDEYDGILAALHGICKNGVAVAPDKDELLNALGDTINHPVGLLGSR